ncbi:MAG: hypothetical protein KIT24_03080 [Phycisphaeraceae bacterium]|nr:hypothetical protein [Phycisphaeraceae bacterium]
MTVLLGVCPCTGVELSEPPAQNAAKRAEPIPHFPYDRYTTVDAFGRTITFYLSITSHSDVALPLIVCVQGSGCQSVFQEVDTPDGPRIASGGPEATMLRLVRDRARILVVEKVGVTFLKQPSQPGSAMEGSDEFCREHTLDRWTEAVSAAVRAALTLPGIDGSRVLAFGHSEGAQVVCHLAAAEERITHVAALAGAGPTQLFDLIELARRGDFGPPDGAPDERAAWVIDGWREVQADPDAEDRFWLGHPHRRWSSFLSTSPIEALHRTKARVFLAQGTADCATIVTASDMAYAELLARGRDVTYMRVEGGDHGFFTPGDTQGWRRVHEAAAAWFLQ